MAADDGNKSAPAAGTARGAGGRSEKTRPPDSTAPARKRRDFAAIAAAALAAADAVVSRWAPDGKREGHEWVCLNPRRGDTRRGSFRLNLASGEWADFALSESDARGGDLIGWVAYLEGCSQVEAADKLAAFLGLDRPDAPPPPRPKAPAAPAGEWVRPVPADAPAPPKAHTRHGAPSRVWVYADRDGGELFRALRFDRPDGGKEVLPAILRREGGRLVWRFAAPPEPRPLYGLDRLADRPGAVVLVCEGEKASDAAGRLLPGFVAVTSPGGSKAASKADWAPLKGRTVRIWPDADPAGASYARDVARLALEAGARSVAVVRLEALARLRGAELPAGFDAADAEGEGMNAEALAALLSDPSALDSVGTGGKAPAKPASAPRAAMAAAGGRFEVLDEDEPEGRRAGVYWVPTHKDREGGTVEGAPEWLCGPLRVVALARDAGGDRWAPVVRFRSPEGTEKTLALPAAWAAGDGREAREALLDRGLSMTTDSRRRARLLAYIMESRPGCFARAAERTGWHSGCFVWPSGEVFGDPGNEPLILGASGEGARLATAGTLEGWRDNVCAPCAAHARLALCLSAAFASMLLGLAGQESGGLHLRGGSSLGKTSALALAASVFGSPAPGTGFIRSWRSTDNALESVAAHHSGLLLALDELAELAPTAAAATSYMLANGSGKARSRRDGSPRPPVTWSLLFLSTGEVGLGDLIAQTGGRAMAGQEVRVIDLPADAGGGVGILSEAPQGMAPGAFVERLRAAAMAHHGHAAREFVARVVERVDSVRELLSSYCSRFVADVAGEDASGQVRRVAARFGLIACGGMLASKFGLTGWGEHTAGAAARRCFADWLAARGTRGTRGALEPAAILRAVRSFIESHGEARFSPFDRGGDDHAPRTMLRAGWRKRSDVPVKEGEELFFPWDYLVFPEAFRREVVAGFDYREAGRVLVSLGVLMPDAEGTATRQERMPDRSRMRVYRISGARLWEVEL